MDAAAPPSPASEVRDGLCKALDSIKAAGSFAAFREISETSVAPIFVHDVGLVGFPLQKSMTRALIEKARQAPYGKGNETFVDKSVRNTWELDAAQLDLGPQWAPAIDDACKWVAQQLGITAPVTAELYKMLIYEEGALFKAHTDTEKIPGMFGTLVICLPSEHQGGDLMLKHHGTTKVFKTSEAQPSMSCWYSDVTHEVLPVASGIRWVLTYNLAITNPLIRPSAALNAPGHDAVRKAMSAWLEFRGRDSSDGQPDHFYYLMEHTYTEANVSLHTLKGVDLNRMRCLKDVCDSQNVSLFFGVLEKEEHGGCAESFDDYYDEEGDEDEDEERDEDEDEGNGDNDDWHAFEDIIETEVSIKKLVTAEGRVVRTGLKISTEELEEKLIQNYEDPFETAEREETDYSGFTGNEGVSAIHWYRMTVAVIVPNDSIDQFLTKGINSAQAQELLPEFLAKCSDPQTFDQGMKMVRQLANRAWLPVKDGLDNPLYYCGPKFDSKVATQFLETLLVHREYELFNTAVGWFKTQVGAWLFALVKKAAREDTFDFSQVKDSLSSNLQIRSVADRMQFLAALAPSEGETHNPRIREWIADEVTPAAVNACLGPTVTMGSGTAIVNLIQEYHDLDYLKTSLAPVIQTQARLTPFSFAALLRIFSFATERAFDKAASLDLCKPLLKSVLDAMDISALRTQNGAAASFAAEKPHFSYDWRRSEAYARNGPHKKPQMFILPEILAACLARCIKYGWDDLAMLLSLKIVSKADTIPLVEFHYLWIPFVRELISTLDKASIPLSTPRYQEIACAIFESYLNRQVGKEPSGAVDYSGQGPVACSCRECPAINRFLQSGERTWRYSAVKKLRQHAEGILGRPGLNCSLHTDSHGSPHTLVVIKNVDSGAKAKKEWNDRFAEAWDEFTKFDQEKLKTLLGAEWERITGMRHLRLSTAQGLVQHVQGGGGPGVSPANLVAGMKRRAED